MLSKFKDFMRMYNGLSNGFMLALVGHTLTLIHDKGAIGRAGRLLSNGCFIEATAEDIASMHPFPWSLHPDNFRENDRIYARILARIEHKLKSA